MKALVNLKNLKSRMWNIIFSIVEELDNLTKSQLDSGCAVAVCGLCGHGYTQTDTVAIKSQMWVTCPKCGKTCLNVIDARQGQDSKKVMTEFDDVRGNRRRDFQYVKGNSYKYVESYKVFNNFPESEDGKLIRFGWTHKTFTYVSHPQHLKGMDKDKVLKPFATVRKYMRYSITHNIETRQTYWFEVNLCNGKKKMHKCMYKMPIALSTMMSSGMYTSNDTMADVVDGLKEFNEKIVKMHYIRYNGSHYETPYAEAYLQGYKYLPIEEQPKGDVVNKSAKSKKFRQLMAKATNKRMAMSVITGVAVSKGEAKRIRTDGEWSLYKMFRSTFSNPDSYRDFAFKCNIMQCGDFRTYYNYGDLPYARSLYTTDKQWTNALSTSKDINRMSDTFGRQPNKYERLPDVGMVVDMASTIKQIREVSPNYTIDITNVPLAHDKASEDFRKLRNRNKPLFLTQKLMDTYEHEGDKYVFNLLKGSHEFIEVGNLLNNCVGGYFGGMKKGNYLLVAMREKATDKPLAAIEIILTNSEDDFANHNEELVPRKCPHTFNQVKLHSNMSCCNNKEYHTAVLEYMDALQKHGIEEVHGGSDMGVDIY